MSSLDVSVSSFPLTTLGIPIATVCPSGVAAAVSNANFAVNFGFNGMVNDNSNSTGPFQPVSLPITSLIASSVVTATAKLPGGFTTAFSSVVRREVEQEATPDIPFILPNGDTAIQWPSRGDISDMARIIVGTEGCQTLYTPTTTAICSTVVSPIGVPAVTVTDCGQYVTFSSEIAYTCAPTSEVRPITASSAMSSGGNGGAVPNTSALGASISTIPSVSTGGIVESVAETDEGNVFSTAVTGAGPTLMRRDFVYTSALSHDVPMSLPRHLLRENQPAKPRVEVSFPRRQIVSTGDFNVNVTIDRHANLETQGDPVTEKPVPLSPEPISMSVQEKAGMSVTLSIPDMASAPQATGMPPHESTDSGASLTLSDAQPPPQPTSTNGTLGVAVLAASEVSTPIITSSSVSDISDDVMPTVSDPFPSTSTAADSLVLSSSIASIPSLEATDLPIHAVQVSPPQPTRYYAAPWYQLTAGFGAVPTNVRGATCYGGVLPPDSCLMPESGIGKDSCGCDIDEEIWSVVSLTHTRIGTTVVSYNGPVVVTASGVSLTTSLSFTKTLTTTREAVYGQVVRSTILPGLSSDDATVYATRTTFPSVTMTMLPGDGVSASQTVAVTASGQQSSSIVDAAAPQGSPASVFSPTGLSTTGPAVSGGSTDMDTVIEGTTFITSIVATETVTTLPSDFPAQLIPAKQTVAPIADIVDRPALATRDN